MKAFVITSEKTNWEKVEVDVLKSFKFMNHNFFVHILPYHEKIAVSHFETGLRVLRSLQTRTKHHMKIDNKFEKIQRVFLSMEECKELLRSISIEKLNDTIKIRSENETINKTEDFIIYESEELKQ